MKNEEAHITENTRIGNLHQEISHYYNYAKKDRAKNTQNKIKHDIKVFLVDDDAFFLKGLHYFLTDNLPPKIKLRKFSNGEDCLNSLDEQPDIIVLDYMLNSGTGNNMNGLAVLKKINEVYPHAFVIMLSSQDSVDVALDTLNEGAYDYLSKSETAFIRLKNMIKNIAETISEDIEQERTEIITKRINFFVIFFLIALFIMSRLIS